MKIMGENLAQNNTCVNIRNTVHVPRSFGTFDLKKSTYFRKRINVTQGTPFKKSAIIGLSQKLQKGPKQLKAFSILLFFFLSLPFRRFTPRTQK
mgnify:CR=1 FL=1